MIEIKKVSEFSEIEGIRSLQQENLRRKLNSEEWAAEGFVTAEYSFELLKAMHDESPSIIAKDGEMVIGYALVALKSIAPRHELLNDLFNTIDKTIYNGRKLKDSSYVVVGQLCVAKGYRGLGLVQKMYQAFRDHLADRFAYCITDVARDNPRSLKAHIKTGFTVIDTLSYGGLKWDIVLWDW